MLEGAMAGPMAGQMANGCGGMAATQMQRGGGLALQAGVLARSSVGNCGRRVVGIDADAAAAAAAACDLRRYLSCSVRNATSRQPGGLSSCAMHLPSGNSKGTSSSERENLRGPTKRFAFPLAQRTPGNGQGEVSRFLLPFPCANQDALSPKRGMSPLRATSSASSAESAFPDVNAVAAADQVALPSKFEEVVDVLTNLFPVWVVIGSVVALWRPAMVTWIQTDTFTLGLGLLMLSMGLTLTFEDFRRCLRNPWTVGVGFLAQYVIKPMLGFSISLALGLPAPLATGLILVSCCPGGQASNVATYISKGNVALSVLMTTCSTIGAIIMTPLLTKVLAGQLIPVDAVGLAVSTFQVVLLPTIVGVLANEFFPSFTRKITFFTPLVGVILTTLLCASPIGQVAAVLKTEGMALIAPVALLHVFAFFIGYWISRACNFGEVTSRTVSIECGMQSSALGFLLAQKHFSNPLVAVPSAVSVVFMALGGAMLAVFWRMKGIPPNDKDDFKE